MNKLLIGSTMLSVFALGVVCGDAINTIIEADKFIQEISKNIDQVNDTPATAPVAAPSAVVEHKADWLIHEAEVEAVESPSTEESVDYSGQVLVTEARQEAFYEEVENSIYGNYDKNNEDPVILNPKLWAEKRAFEYSLVFKQTPEQTNTFLLSIEEAKHWNILRNAIGIYGLFVVKEGACQTDNCAYNITLAGPNYVEQSQDSN